MAALAQEDENCRVVCNNKNVSMACLTCPIGEKTSHGIQWEKPVCSYVLSVMGYEGKEKEKLWNTWLKNSQKENTAVHDIDPHLMGLDKWRPEDKEIFGEGISVKLICMNGDVCMGDLSRIFYNFKHKWSMIVGFYQAQVVNKSKCLCIKSVWYLPFKEKIKQRIELFGDLDDWPEVIEELQDLVSEARTYKKGYGGIASLRNDKSIELVSFLNKDYKKMTKAQRKKFSIEHMCSFDSLTKLQKENRLKTGLKKDSTIQEIKLKQEKCIKNIDMLTKKLSSSDSKSLIKKAIKLDSDQNRVQGRITYNSFLKYVKKNGLDITTKKYVIDNDVLGPIHKI